MADLDTLKEAIRSYYRGAEVETRRESLWRPANQDTLVWEMNMDTSTLSRKLNPKSKQYLTNKELHNIGSILIHWKRITRRSQIQRLFDAGGYPLSETEWRDEPWKSLIDDTQPPQVTLLPLLNPSFDEWKNKKPTKWLCNDKTGWIAQVPGRENKGSSALEIGGNPDNREYVYCRTRETQQLLVRPGSRIGLSLWAMKTEEGKHSERAKYVELFYYDGFDWAWLGGQEVTNDDDWVHYETEWWELPANTQKVSVGVVVLKDGAFKVDDIELRVRTDK